MVETRVIRCDGCNANLTYTENSVDYRLALINQVIPSWNGAVTDMMIYPPIKEDAHFCHVVCLRRWLQKTYPRERRDIKVIS